MNKKKITKRKVVLPLSKAETIDFDTSGLGVLENVELFCKINKVKKEYIELTKYIPEEIWPFILNHPEGTKRTRVVKANTGAGATYGLMQCKGFNRIIVMPTVKLIEDKERQAKEGCFKDNRVYALYGGSDDRIENVFEQNNQSTVILSTPDQLIRIYETKQEIWDKLTDWAIGLDEEHMSMQSGSFRKVFGQLDYLLHNWKGSIATITATAPFTSTSLLNSIRILILSNEVQPWNDIGITRDEQTAWYYFNKWYEAGEKILVVSNDLKKYLITHNSQPSSTICSALAESSQQ